MMTTPDEKIQNLQSRRDFLKSTVATGASAAILGAGNFAFAAGSDRLRVGLIGCGGRGTGAASQALTADRGAVLTAMADVFQQKIDSSIAALRSPEVHVASQVDVAPDRCFVGLEAYKELLASGVDVVLIGSPPGFHPPHIKAAAEAGKHIFAEKPMGTDAVGVRQALDAVRAANSHNRAFVSGYCWRHDYARRAFYQRIHDGMLGKVRHVHATYLTTPVKPMPPASSRPAGMSDVEWQVQNWYNFVWLSGDGLVEQACHSVDKILWAMGDVPPARCVATGGRVMPNNEGNIYDHIDVFYEWEDGTRATMAQRQMPCAYSDNSDFVGGARGYGSIHAGVVEMHTDTTWRYTGPQKNMYQVEHDEFFASIRKGKPINDSENMARSTLAGIMGRMAAYTGEQITWDQMLSSQENLFPENLSWNGSLPIAPMAVPGKTHFV